MIHRLIYASAAREPQTAESLSAILDTSRRNNARDGVTGLLIYHDLTFLQILEGRPEDVKACFARVSGDPRHCEVARIVDGPVEARSFPNWEMGFTHPEDMPEAVRSSVYSVAAFRKGGGSHALGSDPAMGRLVRTILSGLRD